MNILFYSVYLFLLCELPLVRRGGDVKASKEPEKKKRRQTTISFFFTSPGYFPGHYSFIHLIRNTKALWRSGFTNRKKKESKILKQKVLGLYHFFCTFICFRNRNGTIFNFWFSFSSPASPFFFFTFQFFTFFRFLALFNCLKLPTTGCRLPLLGVLVLLVHFSLCGLPKKSGGMFT